MEKFFLKVIVEVTDEMNFAQKVADRILFFAAGFSSAGRLL